MDKSPDAFRTISEVAELLETPAHVLRFWESRFPQIRPVKRAGGRRYYRPADVALLTGIKHLLHDEGMTIRGVQKILREQGVRHVSGAADDASSATDDAALEAALAEMGDPDDASGPLAPAEAETAQIIALQTALRHAPAAPADASDAADDDLFARISRTMDTQADVPDDGTKPPVTEEPVPAETEPLQQVAERASSEVDEAPMDVWTEPAPIPAPEAPDSMTPNPLRITRMAASDRPAPPVTAPPVAAPETPAHATIAQRLRATRPSDLTAADRATIVIVRARARSLRDRLGNQPRPGA